MFDKKMPKTERLVVYAVSTRDQRNYTTNLVQATAHRTTAVDGATRFVIANRCGDILGVDEDAIDALICALIDLRTKE